MFDQRAFDLKGGESISKKALVADRIRMCEQGHWGTLWAHAEMQTSTGTQKVTDELEKVKRGNPKVGEGWEVEGERDRQGDREDEPAASQ